VTIAGKVIAFASDLELARQAAVQNGAILFAGDLHLSPEAQIRRDVVMAEGCASLDGPSRIAGTLYLNPSPGPGREQLIQAYEAQITRGVSKPEDIDSVAAWSLAGWLGLRVLRLIALPLIGIGMLVVLAIYRVWRSRSRRAQPGTGPRLPGVNHQPTEHGVS
jgi:hypothetical protein